ncbi:MAG: hypothetical protein V7K15_18565 [Nostoc sp.]
MPHTSLREVAPTTPLLLYETLRVACPPPGVRLLYETLRERSAQVSTSQYKCPMPSEYQSFCFFPDCINFIRKQ